MLNAGKVNARPVCLPEGDFCEFFRAFAPIPRLQNPVKYIRGSRINHMCADFSSHNQYLAVVTIRKGACAKLFQHLEDNAAAFSKGWRTPPELLYDRLVRAFA